MKMSLVELMLEGQTMIAGAEAWGKFLRFTEDDQLVDSIVALELMA